MIKVIDITRFIELQLDLCKMCSLQVKYFMYIQNILTMSGINECLRIKSP